MSKKGKINKFIQCEVQEKFADIEKLREKISKTKEMQEKLIESRESKKKKS